ncbi:MAG: imidazolonepropionase [Candidatus Nephthysia bennettiae]|nr:MAG: imidazolonepropionase [Candidatus Dormibacteraeota bacterium]
MTLVVRNAGRLVTSDPGLGDGPLGVIEKGALVADGPTIVWVGPERELEAPHGAQEVDAGGCAVLPGLVDCHTHLVFAGDRGPEFAARMRGEPYRAGGIMSTVRATRAASDQELSRLARERLDRFLSFGVTTVEAKTGYGLTSEHELRLLRLSATLGHRVDVVPTLLAAHVVPGEYAVDPDAYVDLVCQEAIPAAEGLAEFCDAWCEGNGAFSAAQCRRVLEAGADAGLRPKLHAEQLSRSGGAALAAELGAVSADHLEQANEEDAERLARAGTIGVLMPGASMTTAAPYAPARMLIERGVRVALSTDFNPGTSYSENLQLQVALGCGLLRMTVEEALLGVTRYAAAAVGREDRCGRLASGLACDLLVLESRSEADLAYHYGVNLARMVVKGGELAA